MDILFDLSHLYHLPQYLPVHEALRKRGVEAQFIVRSQDEVAVRVLTEQRLPHR